MSRPEALRIAREVREEFRKNDEPYAQTVYHSRVLQRVQHLHKTAIEGLAAWAADTVDRQATKSDHDDAPTLPGFDLHGDYKLGDGMRIAKARARVEHMEAALALDNANLESVRAANLRKREELDLLRPYFGGGVRKAEAVAAYQASQGQTG